ncbi:MAG: AraC family transcriptional regulator [Pedobacter sp.]|nr:MAG: AraC family transcriptional regulator [Pedobacter sp.]
MKYRKLRWWEILLNAMPFIVYFSVFLLLVTGIIPPNDANKSLFEQHLTILNPASFTSYAVWSVTSGRSLRDNKLKGKVLLFVFARILLLFVTILSFGVAFSGDLTDEAILLFRITMYICLFLSVLIIFNYKINKLIYSAGKQQHVTDDNSIKLPPLPKYERSSLSEKQLAAYQDRLLKAMQTQRIFLNKELSLTSLASILKIPNHHLTQVFSMQLQQTFYQYINNLRIEHACVLLADSNVPNLEELAEISGFNSKVSFNRHFKAIMNCTPSEFKKKHESRSR